jgi:hypothetical protein
MNMIQRLEIRKHIAEIAQRRGISRTLHPNWFKRVEAIYERAYARRNK